MSQNLTNKKLTLVQVIMTWCWQAPQAIEWAKVVYRVWESGERRERRSENEIWDCGEPNFYKNIKVMWPLTGLN